MKTAEVFKLMNPTMQVSSFVSKPYPIDDKPRCAIGMYITNSFGLSGSAEIDVTIDNINWVSLTGTRTEFTGNDKKMWIVSDVGGIRQLRVRVEILSGVSDFEINAGAG